MKKRLIVLIIILITALLFVACDNKKESEKPPTNEQNLAEQLERNYQELTTEDKPQTETDKPINQDQIEEENEDATTLANKLAQSELYSPFTGLPIDKVVLDRAVMISVENAPQARPQDGLTQASIVYEFLVEGGITRFLALYWGEIPDKIGPVRSVRPYLIRTAEEYNALLLHAGASPEGFDILAREEIKHLDQIYNSRYYWRSNDRKAPHNLYTGNYKFAAYLKKITGQEYTNRFPFQRISFIDQNAERANKITINYWGDNTVCYQYNINDNLYYRYITDLKNPHNDASGKQLSTTNLLVQYVNTDVIDSIGRLKMDLEGKGDAIYFKDGVVRKGYWQKKEEWTNFYDENGKLEKMNPGKTWIEVVPLSVKVEYEE